MCGWARRWDVRSDVSHESWFAVARSPRRSDWEARRPFTFACSSARRRCFSRARMSICRSMASTTTSMTSSADACHDPRWRNRCKFPVVAPGRPADPLPPVRPAQGLTQGAFTGGRWMLACCVWWRSMVVDVSMHPRVYWVCLLSSGMMCWRLRLSSGRRRRRGTPSLQESSRYDLCVRCCRPGRGVCIPFQSASIGSVLPRLAHGSRRAPL